MSPILQSLANGSARGYGAFVPLGAAGAFESIASASGTGSSGSITFSSIPSTYQHLQIRGIFRCDKASNREEIRIRFNSDTATNYAKHQLGGDGSSVFTDSGVSTTFIFPGNAAAATTTANIIGVSIIDIQDYKSTSKYKTVRSLAGLDQNNSAGQINLCSGLWMNTAAITSIEVSLFSDNWTTQTQIALYGIKGA